MERKLVENYRIHVRLTFYSRETDTLRQAIGDVNRRRCGNDAFALEKKKKKKRKRKRERSFERNRALICMTRDVELEKGDFY